MYACWCQIPNTDANSRNFPIAKVLRSKSGLTSQGQEPTTYHNGSCHITSSRMLPTPKKCKCKLNVTHGTPTNVKIQKTSSSSRSIVPEKVDESRQYDSMLSEFANAKATDISIDIDYKPGVRILTIIAMPNYSVLLDAVYHCNWSHITHNK
jgi:hypothetical protein